MTKENPYYPPGWDESRVREVMEYYENQTDEEAIAEMEYAYERPGYCMMQIPQELVPEVEALLARHERS